MVRKYSGPLLPGKRSAKATKDNSRPIKNRRIMEGLTLVPVLQSTTESQGHGKSWERAVSTSIFKITETEMCDYTHTDKYDIKGKHNRRAECLGKNVSIKTTQSGSIDCGDIMRFLGSTNVIMVCIIYGQIAEKKVVQKTIVFDIEKFIQSVLHEELKSLNIDIDTWNKDVEGYVNYVKVELPKSGKVNHEEYPYKHKKADLCKGLNCFNIAPKVDSKTQRRVQCSIKISELKKLKSYEEFNGSNLWGETYIDTILSPPRKRNK